MQERYARLVGATLLLIAIILAVLLMRPDPSSIPAAPIPPLTTPTPSSPSSPEPDPADQNLPIAVFIGDSYAAGTGASSRGKRWTNLVTEAKGWQQENLALGGTGFVSVAGRAGCGRNTCENFQSVARSIRGQEPQVIVVSGGQNDLDDWENDPARVTRAINATYRELRRHHPEALLLAVGPSNVDQTGPPLSAMDAAVKAAAELVDARYVSLLEPPVIVADMVLPDGQVDDSGHEAIATRVLEALR